jgi:hypothetical protein
MDTTGTIAVAVSSGLSLVGLVWLYFWPYRDYRRDLFRARLFAIRAELFDGAADGRIDFNHPAYGLLRSTMNGFLRFGHRFGTLRLIAMAVIVDPDAFSPDYDFDRRWREATRPLDAETKEWLRSLREQMHQAFLAHLVMTSLFGCIFCFALLGRHTSRAQRRAAQRTTSGGRLLASRIDSVALANNYLPQQQKAA